MLSTILSNLGDKKPTAIEDIVPGDKIFIPGYSNKSKNGADLYQVEILGIDDFKVKGVWYRKLSFDDNGTREFVVYHYGCKVLKLKLSAIQKIIVLSSGFLFK